MKSRSFRITLVLLCFCSVPLFAQTPPPTARTEKVVQANTDAPPCPKIDIQSSSGKVLKDGQPAVFGASIAGGEAHITPTIVWSVSAGSILNGQGTRTINVDTTGAGQNREIVADLWVGGYAPECASQASTILKVIGPATKLDEFNDLTVEKENEKLAGAVNALSNTNDSVYLVAYAGRTNARGYAVTALRRMKTQLTTAGITADRIGTIDGGFREDPAYEIWIVPAGADAPKPSPTVDRREIIYPKMTPVKTAPSKKP